MPLDAATSAVPAVPSAVPAPSAEVINPPPLHLPSANAVLELADGTRYEGISFGAAGKSIAGECVFQTGQYQHSNLD